LFATEVAVTPDGWQTPRRFVFCVQIKGEDEKVLKFLINDVVYHVLATNLPKDVSPQRAFELYRGRGAAEEANKELKHDLDLERLPSPTFSVKEVFLTLGAMAYNLLILLGQQWQYGEGGAEGRDGQTNPVQRRRIKTHPWPERQFATCRQCVDVSDVSFDTIKQGSGCLTATCMLAQLVIITRHFWLNRVRSGALCFTTFVSLSRLCLTTQRQI
jgi:hypothetical protein